MPKGKTFHRNHRKWTNPFIFAALIALLVRTCVQTSRYDVHLQTDTQGDALTTQITRHVATQSTEALMVFSFSFSLSLEINKLRMHWQYCSFLVKLFTHWVKCSNASFCFIKHASFVFLKLIITYLILFFMFLNVMRIYKNWAVRHHSFWKTNPLTVP